MAGSGLTTETHVVKSKVNAMDFNSAGEGSSKIKKSLQLIGIRPELLRRIAIISYESEMNMVIHSNGGYISCEFYPDRIKIMAIDQGPGIENINKAMEEGYSTATDDIREMGFGAGMGLANIKRCADIIEVESSLGKGTTLVATVYL